MVDAKNRNMHKYKKTNLVLVLTVLITVLFQGFVKAEIIKWTNCKTIEDPFSESLWKMLQETQETKIPFDKEKWLKDENEKTISIHLSGFDCLQCWGCGHKLILCNNKR